MDDTDKEKLRVHNKRVRDAAKRLPTKGLQASFMALGYRADKDTSTETSCAIDGMTMAGIASMSRNKVYERSVRSLWRDLNTLEDMGIAHREPGERGDDGRQEPDFIMLRFGEIQPPEPKPVETDAYREPKPRAKPRARHDANELPHHCHGCLELFPADLAAYAAGDLTDDGIMHVYDAHRKAILAR